MHLDNSTVSPSAKLRAAFAEALGISPDGPLESTAYGQTEGWDSVAHMALIAALESQFEIMLDTDDVIALSSYSEARRILTKYGVEFD